MYLEVRMPEADKYEVIDVLTGQRIPLVQSANDETGIISMLLRDGDGNFIEEYNPQTDSLDVITFYFKPIRGFKFRKKEVT